MGTSLVEDEMQKTYWAFDYGLKNSAEKEHEFKPTRSPLRLKDFYQRAAALVGFMAFSFSVLEMGDGRLKYQPLIHEDVNLHS